MNNNSARENPQYKDRLFKLLFGSMEMKDNVLSLCSALYGTKYTDGDVLEINTLDDVIFVNMKNDVSFLIGSYLTLWEQQSSFNPNMPIRGFLYFSKLYEGYIDCASGSIYGTKMIKLPTPRYAVFYNGKKDAEPVTKLKLSEAFMQKDNSCEFEWTATMYNLNNGKNDELLSKCKPLSDYMTLINYIREFQDNGLGIADAVSSAVDKCIEEDVLRSFLKKQRAEVMDVCITEFDENKYKETLHQEGFDDGYDEGYSEGHDEGYSAGHDEGFTEGRDEGINSYDRVAILLRDGDSPESLIQKGYSKDIVIRACNLLRIHYEL